jgi:hypothetical protein
VVADEADGRHHDNAYDATVSRTGRNGGRRLREPIGRQR